MRSQARFLALAVMVSTLGAAEARAEYTFVNEVQQRRDTYPHVAADASGNSLVVWTKDWTQPSAQIRGRLYDPTGNPLTSELSIVNDGQRALVPSICARDGGGWVVAWLRFADGQMGIGAQVFSAAAEPVGSFIDVASGGDAVIPNDPETACLPGGAFLVSWTNASYDAMVRRIEPDGSRGTTTTASQDDDQSLPAFTHTKVVAGPGGQAIVLWANGHPFYYGDGTDGLDGSDSTMLGRLLDSSGTPTGQIFQINTEGAGSQGSTGFAAAYAPDGDFLVAYTSGDHDWPSAMAICGHMPCGVLMAQRFQSDGTPEGSEFMVNEDLFGDHLHPAVSPDGSGGFLVAWELQQQDGYARAFDANGDPIHSQFVLNSGSSWTRMINLARTGSAWHVVWDAGREIAHKMLTSIPDPGGPPDPPDPPDAPEHCPETPAENCSLANPGSIRLSGDNQSGKMRWNWRRNDNGQSAGSMLSGALLCIYDGNVLRHEHRIPGLLSAEGTERWTGRGTRWTYRRADGDPAGVSKLKSVQRETTGSRVSVSADGIESSAMRSASDNVVQIYTGSGECWQAPGTDRD
jgi:hypothetical protein